MTSMQEYYNDLSKVWSAVFLLGSIMLAGFVVMVSHLIWGN